MAGLGVIHNGSGRSQPRRPRLANRRYQRVGSSILMRSTWHYDCLDSCSSKITRSELGSAKGPQNCGLFSRSQTLVMALSSLRGKIERQEPGPLKDPGRVEAAGQQRESARRGVCRPFGAACSQYIEQSVGILEDDGIDNVCYKDKTSRQDAPLAAPCPVSLFCLSEGDLC